MIFKILQDGKVVNRINATLEFMSQHYPAGNYELEPEVVAPTPAAPVNTKITCLAFLNRFTDVEAIAIDLASIGATPQAAAMRRYQKKVDAASFIDLSAEDTRTGVTALEVIGLLAPGRALDILDAPVTEAEAFK